MAVNKKVYFVFQKALFLLNKDFMTKCGTIVLCY